MSFWIPCRHQPQAVRIPYLKNFVPAPLRQRRSEASFTSGLPTRQAELSRFPRPGRFGQDQSLPGLFVVGLAEVMFIFICSCFFWSLKTKWVSTPHVNDVHHGYTSCFIPVQANSLALFLPCPSHTHTTNKGLTHRQLVDLLNFP